MKLRYLLQALTILKWALTKCTPNIDLSEVCTYENYSKIRLFSNKKLRFLHQALIFLEWALRKTTPKMEFLIYQVTMSAPSIDYSEMSTDENNSKHPLFWNEHLGELLKISTCLKCEVREASPNIDYSEIRTYENNSEHRVF